VHLLECTTISTLARWGIKGVRTENPGVWEESGERKIAALGVHLRRNVTSYGVGLNVTTDLRWFERIVACGLVGKGVTTMKALGEAGHNLMENPNKPMERLEPGVVGKVWINEFVKGLYGDKEVEKIVKIGVEELGLD
jgi:lipoate-protein ligase B